MNAMSCWVSVVMLLAVGCTVTEAEPAEFEGYIVTPSDEPPTPGCVPWRLCNTAPPWSAITCDPAATDECAGLDAEAVSCRPDGLCAAAPPSPDELCPRDDDGNGLCRSTNGVVNMLIFGQHAAKP